MGIRNYCGLRNSIVHRYCSLDMGRVVEALDGIDRLYRIAAKLTLICESMPDSDTAQPHEREIRADRA